MNTIKKIRYSIVVFVILFHNAPFYQNNETAFSADVIPSHIYENAISSVYTIVALQDGEKREGTAFAVHPGGFLASCGHGFKSGDDIFIRDMTGNEFPVMLINHIPQYDLAILKTTSSHSLNYIQIIYDTVSKYNSSFFSIGNLNSEGLIILQGRYAKKGLGGTQDFGVSDCLTFDMAVDSGCSGGPVFNHDGNIIGMVFGSLGNSVSLSQAIPSIYIERACEETTNLEAYTGRSLGLAIETKNNGVFISSIKKNSPASSLDISVGDRILALDKWSINNGIDYYLSELILGTDETTQSSVPIRIFSNKNNKELLFNIPFLSNVITCEKSIPQLEQGCQFSIFQKNVNSSCLLAKGWTKSLNVSCTDRKHSIMFQGYLKIPEEGSYCFYLDVNGTGMFSLGDSFTIEKIIPHPKMPVMKRGFFSKGYHKLNLNIDLHEKPSGSFLFVNDSSENIVPVPDEWIYSKTDIGQEPKP